MRTNLPVTQREVELRDDMLIVSKTDLKGLITYANRDFVEISGFSEAELIGEPHNIVRHPDMPPEAYQDLWNTLKAGRPWTGLVKNRCKNGDYYWVHASATPMEEGGQVVGYMSVRRKPTREQIAQAEPIYRLFREKQAGRLRILHGNVVKGRGPMLNNLSLAKRLGAGFTLLGALVAGMVGYFLWQQQQTEAQVQSIVDSRLVPAEIIGRIGKLMADNRAEAMLVAQHDPADPNAKAHDHPVAVHTDAIGKHISEITQLWEQYMTIVSDPQHQELAEAFTTVRKRYVIEGLIPVLKAAGADRLGDARVVVATKIEPLYQEAATKRDALYGYLQSGARSYVAQMHDEAVKGRMIVAAMLAALLAASVLLVWWLIRSLTNPMRQILDVCRNVMRGNYSNRIDIARNDEMGKVLQGLHVMQTRMGFEVQETLRVARQNLRIKNALDKVESNVMLADANLNIVYMNETVTAMMSRNEAELKKVLPQFDAGKLIGTNIDVFHRNPAHQRGLLANLRAPHKTQIKVGALTFGLTATPVIDANGEHVGTAVEWKDRTAEVAVEEEVAGIVGAANDGDFTKRLALEGKDGFFRTLAEGINGLMQTSSVGLAEVVRVLSALARGDLTEKITNDYKGTFGQLKDDSNRTVEQLTAIMSQIKQTAESISTASSEIAAGNQDLSSRTEEQASSLEETASSMEELTGTVKQNAENSRQANQLAASASDVAVKGGRVVGEVVNTMSSINESSKKIVDIISVIDGIAFQTNILALNAAVEAARAGEQGRGFAVVASEVRNLAQRSAAAAKEIKTLIGDSVEKVGAGTKLVEAAGQTMEEIVASVKRVTDIMAEITAASQEQSSGIEQVNQAVTQMDQTTQQNAALVEEAAAAAESMKEQAGHLSQAVAVFKLAAGAEGHARPAAAKPASRLAVVKPAAPAARPAAKGAAPQRAAGATRAKAAANGSGEEAWEEF